MKKKLTLSAVAALLLSAVSAIVYVNNERDSMDDLFNANVEALANGEGSNTAMSYICKYIGCCGGDRKCFTGSVSIKGIMIQGTFYMN